MAASIAGSAILGSNAASDAADTQAASAGKAIDTQDLQYQQTRQDQLPFLQAGVRALGKLESAAEYTPFGMDQYKADPGYAFRLSEGQKALDRSAAARGGLISGSALKAATRYGQDMGSQEYTNAFNRYQAERTARLGPLQSLAGVGQTTAQSLGQTGAANAANVGNLITGAGAAQAAGMVGGANAVSGGLSSYMNYNQGNRLIDSLQANNLNRQYGASNVYGAGGGGTVPSASSINYDIPY
jgi:hypothetical protein